MGGEPRALALRREAAGVLGPLADLAAPVAPGADPPFDQLLRIREHQVDRAAECVASVAHDGEFDGWRAAFARRRLGLAVLERMRRGATEDPSALARDVIAHEARSSQSGLASWLAELGPGGASVVAREAVGFAVATRVALRSWPPRDGTRFGDTFSWDLPGRAVRLEAAVDAVTRPTRSLLVLTSAAGDEAGERRDLAWPALVATLRTGQVPHDVTRIDLASGERRRVPVTDDVLDAGLTLAAAAVEAMAAAWFGPPGPTAPGRWCWRCRGRDGCAPGQAWLNAPTREPHAR